MKKQFIIFVVCLGVFLFFSNYSPYKKARGIDIKRLNKKQYEYYVLKDNVLDYLKTKSDLKDAFEPNKKLILNYMINGCPYSEKRNQFVKTVIKNPEYNNKYTYFTRPGSMSITFDNVEDSKAFNEFYVLCQKFCIINPQKKQLFRLNRDGMTEAAAIPSIMKQLLYW